MGKRSRSTTRESENLQSPELLKALAQYEKRLCSLVYDKLPQQLEFGVHLDLSHWTLITKDQCLHSLLEHYSERLSITTVNLEGGDKITDVGLNAISEKHLKLQTLILDNLFQVSESALQKLVKSTSNHLLTLSLSGCLGINGIGFAIIGEYSKNLKTLKLSGCRQIIPWALRKIFEGCCHLENIDVSYCSLITDQELMILGDSCKELKFLNLKECRQVSDVGVLSLGQGCCGLQDFNVARSDLVSRITDISLMALGEHCNCLSSLNIAGCEMITDAGLSWLAKGCKQLEILNISNCSKITNGGMRYLGEEYLRLKTIIMVNVKKVSDVGLRYLADGCHNLEEINASGLYMLSDGVERNFGFEGVQSLGKSPCSKTLRKINFFGCFQISRVSLLSLSEMSNLESLGLSGCKKLCPSKMMEVAKSCTKLSSLSLASCGDCVGNSMIESMAGYLVSLRALNISDCKRVGTRALEKISKCPKLTNLILSGCTNVTNDGVLALCNGIFKPTYLYLDRCHKITDTALTWIVDGFQDEKGDKVGDVSLLTLSLRGTKVSLGGVKAIREHFRHSTLKANATFLGFLSMSRVADRKMINKHGKEGESAVKIQSLVRALQSRQLVRELRERQSEARAVTKIASYWRGRMARVRVKAFRYNRWLRHVSSIRMQCLFRGKCSRKVAQRLRDKQWKIEAPYAAKKIQKMFRGKRGRDRTYQIRKAHHEILLEKGRASIHIQSLFRVWMAKRLRRKREHEKRARIDLERVCATRIQVMWRSEMAKKAAQTRKQTRRKQRDRIQKAKNTISKLITVTKFRSAIDKRVSYRKMLNCLASSIQKWYRERKSVFREREQEAMRIKIYRNECCTAIQKTWLRKAAYMELSRLYEIRERNNSLKREKAMILTRWVKMCLAQQLLYTLRIQHRKALMKQFQMESWASIQISSGWRGYKGRRRVHTVIRSKQSRWKQMWSEKDERYFFFNKVTGESRWRKPQEILDMEIEPICSNCDFYKAQIECSDCSEFFCNTCWDAVHFGGKRRNHEFRSLYDYYGKRVDYGESEFPSKWPTEIIQDDELGWQLRVRPYRKGSGERDGVAYYIDGETGRTLNHDERNNTESYNK